MRKLSVSLSRIAARVVFMVPLTTGLLVGCDSSSESPANKAASEEHGAASTKNMENFMKNAPKDAPRKPMPQTK